MTPESEPSITLKEYFDGKIDEVKEELVEVRDQNAKEHEQVQNELRLNREGINELKIALRGVVTWRALAAGVVTGITAAGILIGIAFALVDHI